jgi:hypothetical protein
MEISEIEKILGDKEYKMRDTIKFVYESDEPLIFNKKREVLLFPKVPGEIIKTIEAGKYEVMVKACSLKAYVRKVRGEK